jgi:hypothetical protein
VYYACIESLNQSPKLNTTLKNEYKMKYTSLILASAFICPTLQASAPESEVEGLCLVNSMIASEDDSGDFQVIRTSQPRKDQQFNELADLEVADVIIFKTDTRGEVVKEIKALEDRGINSHHIPFKWADHESFKKVCKQTIKALKIVKNSWENSTKVVIHCSHGQDRTGYLAGIINLLDNPVDLRENFQSNLCNGGYGSGNPDKPAYVVNKIRQATTNLYLKMSWKVLQGDLTWDSLSEEACSEDPDTIEAYVNAPEFEFSSYKCEASPRFQ